MFLNGKFIGYMQCTIKTICQLVGCKNLEPYGMIQVNVINCYFYGHIPQTCIPVILHNIPLVYPLEVRHIPQNKDKTLTCILIKADISLRT